MCASIFGPIEQTDIVQRRSKGLTTTFYVCCSSGFPNTYTSSAPAEATYLSWYAAAEDYDGFLRWAYHNSWVEDPIRDSRFRKWAAGDTYLVYPEGRSSIRFERLVEGIQDWEKNPVAENGIQRRRRETANPPRPAGAVPFAGRLRRLGADPAQCPRDAEHALIRRTVRNTA